MWHFKGAKSNFVIFFQTSGSFGVCHRKAQNFLLTHGEFHSSKEFRLEDIKGNVPDYGNHNSTYTKRYIQLQFSKSLCTNK